MTALPARMFESYRNATDAVAVHLSRVTVVVQQRNLNVYATAHLSGDVANAVTLLKRMTRPASRKHKAGLLVSSEELAACQVGSYCRTSLCRSLLAAHCLIQVAW